MVDKRGVKLTRDAARKVAKVVGIIENEIGDAPDGGERTKFDVRLRWAELTETLSPASDGKTAPTTAAGILLNRNRNSDALDDGREIEIVNRLPNVSGEVGDVLVVANVQGEWTTVFHDDNSEFPTGVGNCHCWKRFWPPCDTALPDATICCNGQYEYSLIIATLGTFTLFHQGADIYSTFSDDVAEDNPYTHSHVCCVDDPPPALPSLCETVETEDIEYDVVFDATLNKIWLQYRTAPVNCDPVCLEYHLNGTVFQCNMTNEFRLGKFAGWGMDSVVNPDPGAGGELQYFTRFARCICLIPAGGCPSEICTTDCDEAHAGETVTMTFTIAGISGAVGGICPAGHFNRSWTLAVTGTCAWGETHNVIGTGSYSAGAVPNGDGAAACNNPGSLRFAATCTGESTINCACYEASSVNCEGLTTYSLVSSACGTGWPATIDVTVVYA